MKKNIFLLGLITIILFFGCKKDDPKNGGDDVSGSITCIIVQPQEGQSFMEDEPIMVAITATDKINLITEVELLIDNQSYGTTAESPYVFTIKAGTLFVGQHTIKAVAKSNKGGQNSTSIKITIESLGDESPSFVTFTDGNIPESWKTSTWTVDVATGYDDNYSLRANMDAASVVTTKTMSQYSYIEFFVKGENINFFIDSDKQTALHSEQVENSWKRYVYEIAPGTHQFRWETIYAMATYLDKITFAPASIPEVSTNEVGDITATSAISGGSITNSGNSPVSIKGICWSISENPTIEGNKTTDGSGTEPYTSQMKNLEVGTTYYVRAYATNTVGTSYGEQVAFTTLGLSLPTVITKDIYAISNAEAESGGDVTDDGFDPVTARGVCWSTSNNPTVDDYKTVDGAGLGSFSSRITGLVFGETYYLRAYATNSQGTVYGEERSFKTELNIGEYYQGGFIAYLDATGEHGFIITAGDLDTNDIEWTNNGQYIQTYADGEDVGTGKSNTEKIVDVLGSGVYAAKLCYDLVIDGYDDWFLPSTEELRIIMNKNFLPEASGYWSSTEYTNYSYAYIGYLSPNWGGGTTFMRLYRYKDAKYPIRAIRYF